MKFNFGESQLTTGNLMSRYPKLAKIIYRIFGYTNIGNYARSRVVIKLLNKLPLSHFRDILDLGCGYGEFTFMMAEKLNNTQFTALDISEKRIHSVEKVIEARDFKNIIPFLGTIDKLQKNKLFDFIFSVDVFEHILKDEMPFNECFSRLNQGGYLLVKIPNNVQKTILPDIVFKDHNKWLKDEHIGQVYDLSGLEKRFIEAGFKIVYKSYSDGVLSRIAWELGYISKKAGSLFQLLSLPICKSLILIDNILPIKNAGNAIQVIGQKV